MTVLIVLLESMMQCVSLQFCCVFFIVQHGISKKRGVVTLGTCWQADVTLTLIQVHISNFFEMYYYLLFFFSTVLTLTVGFMAPVDIYVIYMWTSTGTGGEGGL